MAEVPELVVRADTALVDGRLQPAVIEVTRGRITWIGTGAAAAPSTRVGGAGVALDVPPGTILLPGNVDSHVHVNEPGRTDWEGFASATEAAARGGITCIVDMPLNSIPPTTDRDALRVKRRTAAGRLHVDAAFWGGAVPENLGWLEDLWQAGVFGFKCFLADSGVPEFPPLDTGGLGRAMAEVAGFDGLLLVHAEDPAVLLRGATTPTRNFRDFMATRPDEAEVAAIGTVINGVREHGTRTHLLHLSSALALDLIADARAEGLPLTVETCPHYLVFDVDSLPDSAPEFKCCPPIRDLGNQKALWDGLRDGIIDCVVSDHSPSTLEEKQRGGGDLQVAWGGIASLQVSFPTMVDAAAERGIGIERVSEWMAAKPALIAGVPGKGRFTLGADADLVCYEPGRRIAVDGRLLAHRNKLSAYTGRVLSGSVSRSIVRGRTVFDGENVPDPRGRAVLRAGA